MDRKLKILILKYRVFVFIEAKFIPKPNDVIRFEYNKRGNPYSGDFVVNSVFVSNYNEDGEPEIFDLICILINEREVFSRNCKGCYWHNNLDDELNEEYPCLECGDYKLHKPKYATLINNDQ